MHDVVRILLDEDSVMELQPYYADNIITCFGRLGGHSVGVIAQFSLFYGRKPGHQRFQTRPPASSSSAMPSEFR